MSTSVIVMSLDGQHKPLACPYSHEKIICNVEGWGRARNWAIAHSKGELIIMVNGDITINPAFWTIAKNLPKHCFLMTDENGPCSHILAFWRSDNLRFDSSLKYVFEDGDFYLRAIKQGLHGFFIPKSLYFHKPHIPKIWLTYPACFFADMEYCKVYVKHNRMVRSDLWSFFINNPFSFKRVPSWFFRLFATFYWIVHFNRPLPSRTLQYKQDLNSA